MLDNQLTSKGKEWCPETDLNRRHADFQSGANHVFSDTCKTDARQTGDGASMAYAESVKPADARENENPGALAGATGADLHSSVVADEDSLKRTEAARALAAAVSDCDPRDRIPLLKRLLDYHLGIGRGFFLGPGDWS